MFKLASEVIQGVVSSLAKGARKAKLGEKFIFIKTKDDKVSFYFNGDDMSVERKISADIQGELDVATSIKELDQKVSALPKEEEITVEKEGNLLKLKWGKGSKISVEILPETAPLIEIPQMSQQVKWAAGTLHGIARMMTPFAALPDSPVGRARPSVCGPNFQKDGDTGEVFIRATDSYRAVTVLGSKIDWFEGNQLSMESKTMLSLADVLSEQAELTVGLNESGTLVIFRAGLTTAIARVLEGSYPNIDKYADDAKSKWHFDRLELIELCRRIKRLSPTKPIIQFRIQSGKVKAIVPNSLEQQLAVAVEGEASDFGANAEYLEMTASLYRSDEIVLLADGANQPITIRQEENDNVKALVLPVRID
ncbi:DNA polymerase-3 subunit beta [Evansella vedderi]|uniref:DNA polymerase-3 subunit beta n=1 Tax=Evansella vedderi TaxID=38282 RepID=A0ABT9ZZS0_9BACI|nr:hypothetical protein [Evansella vedderi]MDQ0255580.1 DNA polymerase-3 subunit beta [Evansella vedderi]